MNKNRAFLVVLENGFVYFCVKSILVETHPTSEFGSLVYDSGKNFET